MKNLGWDKVKPHREAIADTIISHVRENHCCRVGWACWAVLRKHFDDGEHVKLDIKSPVEENCLDKIAAMVCADGEFIKEEANVNFPYDWNIRLNPMHKKKFFENPLVLVLIGAIFTFLSTWLVDYIKGDPKPPQLTMTKELEQALRRDSMRVQKIHDTIYLPDSLLRKH